MRGTRRKVQCVSELDFPPLLDAVFEALRLGKRLQLLQRVVLDLTDALPRDAEGAPDLLQGAGRIPVKAEPKLDHLALTGREGVERPLDVLLPERQRGRVEG